MKCLFICISLSVFDRAVVLLALVFVVVPPLFQICNRHGYNILVLNIKMYYTFVVHLGKYLHILLNNVFIAAPFFVYHVHRSFVPNFM